MDRRGHVHHQQKRLLEEKSSRQNTNNIMVSSSSSSFSYSDVPHQLGVTHLHNFDSNPEIYNLTSAIEMIGFQPKPPSIHHHHHHHGDDQNQNLMVAPAPSGQQQEVGFVDDDQSSLRTCVFPCEGNERPSQGLSLSLSSSNPSTIGLQSFELRHHHHNNNDQSFNISSSSSNSRDGFVRKSSAFHHHHQSQEQEQFFLGKSVVSGSSNSEQFEWMRNSMYMAAAQELLHEFCSLGTKQISQGKNQASMKKDKEKWEFKDGVNDVHHNNQNSNHSASNSSSSRNNIGPSLCGVSPLDLQKRNTKLLAMLQELDRRYKRYFEQMKGVVSSFEVVGGPEAANVYTALASKAMSRHFRCLRDAIATQIKATNKAMGEKDANNAALVGSTRGETPRLRVLDQAFRQQRAFQQMTMMESHPWRPQRGLPERSVSALRAWLFEHFLHPYPSDVDKHILARQTGLTRSQVSNWFINARVRLWKPMVEQMYQEETKEEQDKNMMGSASNHQPPNDHHGSLIQPPPHDQKPNPDDHHQLVRIDPESLSSIINNTITATTSNDIIRDDDMNNNLHKTQFGVRGERFGSVDHLDFQTYGATQNDNNAPQGFVTSGGGNVSLTLGLQQHGGGGVSLAFPPASQTANSLFFARDHHHINDYASLLEGDQGQNLPYSRNNLMGAQLLHDFA